MDERVSNSWAKDAIAEEESYAALRQQGITEAQQHRLQMDRAEVAKLKEADAARRKQQQSVSVQAAPTGQLPFSCYVGSTDVAPYLVWGGVVLTITWIARASIWDALFNRKKAKVEGRWVYDRSLGGRKIWVTEGDATPAGSSETPVLAANAAPSSTPTLLRDEKFQKLASMAAAASPTVAAASSFSTESPPSGRPRRVCAPCMEEANRVCSRLESSKVRGMDYSLGDIVQLRGDVPVEAAATAAMANIGSSSAQLGDEESPLQFVVNIAADLEVPEERAVPMIQAVAASTARSRLLEAVACLKAGNETGCQVAIARLVLLLTRLPVILEGSKEAELIASSLGSTTKVEERTKLFIMALDCGDPCLVVLDEQLKRGGGNGLDYRTLYRWFVARKWNVANTMKALSAHAVYREREFPGGQVPQELVQTDLDQHKVFVNGYDNQGNPFCVVLGRRHIPHSHELTRRCMEYCLDAAVRLGNLNPAWNGRTSAVFDLAGFSYVNCDFPGLLAVFDLLQNHYPERLDKLFLYRAPALFNAIWSLVRPFIDPVTREKVVFVTEKHAAREFTKHFNMQVFPKELGGLGSLRSVDDVWRQVLGEPFGTGTTLHAPTGT
ncbi:MAG: hypothetical protein WDW38_003874 [Sanguina aurantia]